MSKTKTRSDWKSFQEYLNENEMGGTTNRHVILNSIPAHLRKQDKDGKWMISPLCPSIHELKAKGLTQQEGR